MTNEEWEKITQMMHLLSPFTTCVLSRLFCQMKLLICRSRDCSGLCLLPDEMADMSIAGLQWSMLIPRLNYTGSHRPIDSHSKPYLH